MPALVLGTDAGNSIHLDLARGWGQNHATRYAFTTMHLPHTP